MFVSNSLGLELYGDAEISLFYMCLTFYGVNHDIPYPIGNSMNISVCFNLLQS